MGCEMKTEQSEEMDVVLSSMWPEDLNEAGRQFNVEIPGGDNDMLEEVTINKESNIVDFKRLMELTNYGDKGNWQLANLLKNWEYKQENAVRLLREELDNLSKQQQAVELKILEEHRFEQDGYGGNKRPISILDDENLKYLYQDVKKAVVFQDEQVKVDAEYDSVVYWKQRALSLEKLLEASVGREKALMVKLQESVENLERQSTPVERDNNFLHFVLKNAPVVIGHQDKQLRYQFAYNYFPGLEEGDIIGKTDVEVFTGAGVKESQDFKREVLERGLPAKREITFETELFGSKTFLMYVEPVFSKAGETLGVNYMGMEVTDQVRKREKMAKLSEEMAVQKAKETELNKTIHIQGVMKLETTKFRPREIVKHVLQTAAASLQKLLTIEGDVADDVPAEVIGDVLRFRQILTNLVSNAIKFTHEGRVGVNLYVVPEASNVINQDSQRVSSENTREDLCMSRSKGDKKGDDTCDDSELKNTSNGPGRDRIPMESDSHIHEERIVWIHCDVYDTGIGMPEHAIPTLFNKYIQVGADTARKYGGTGSGLAICKQLVELMGGRLSVSSLEHHGSTFTFVLPYKVSDDPNELSDMDRHDVVDDANIPLLPLSQT